MTQNTLYGNVLMLRAKCPKCKKLALVQDGLSLCCGSEFKKELIPTKVKRMSEPDQTFKPHKRSKAKQLEFQDYRCLYCEQTFNSEIFTKEGWKHLTPEWDHIEPYSYSQNNFQENMVLCCKFCNMWKHNYIFNSIDEIKIFVQQKWESIKICQEPES